MIGQISIEREQQLVQRARQYLEQQAEHVPAYVEYLSAWGEWDNPWLVKQEPPEEVVNTESTEGEAGG
jgi:isoleucyl-tRNA synthetase